ncbi:hypothetical protein T492DRAFT_974799 [Pavlovales sp. CCMP2436]|nr:hypothetical protein T492DRAFT_974799 [Pavlovales sp. CCMP2436]
MAPGVRWMPLGRWTAVHILLVGLLGVVAVIVSLGGIDVSFNYLEPTCGIPDPPDLSFGDQMPTPSEPHDYGQDLSLIPHDTIQFDGAAEIELALEWAEVPPGSLFFGVHSGGNALSIFYTPDGAPFAGSSPCLEWGVPSLLAYHPSLLIEGYISPAGWAMSGKATQVFVAVGGQLVVRLRSGLSVSCAGFRLATGLAGGLLAATQLNESEFAARGRPWWVGAPQCAVEGAHLHCTCARLSAPVPADAAATSLSGRRAIGDQASETVSVWFGFLHASGGSLTLSVSENPGGPL